MLDVLKPLGDKTIIERELEGFGIRLNKKPPAISFKKKEKGGINMTSTVTLTHLDADLVKAILSEYKIHNADIAFRCDATQDDLIDILEGYEPQIYPQIEARAFVPNIDFFFYSVISNRIYIPALYVLNKIDQVRMCRFDRRVAIRTDPFVSFRSQLRNSISFTRSHILFRSVHTTNGTLTIYWKRSLLELYLAATSSPLKFTPFSVLLDVAISRPCPDLHKGQSR